METRKRKRPARGVPGHSPPFTGKNQNAKGRSDSDGRMRRVGRPTVGEEPRKLIAIRLDSKVLGWLRETAEKKGLPYQSLVNQILAEEMKKAS
jgi:uncharacterized protein (DUF4415 family)